MKIAIAQLNPTIGDLAGNAQHILRAARQAADQGVRLLLTPELSLCGYPPRDLLMNPRFVGNMATTLHQLAADLPSGVAVLVGTVEPNTRSLQEGGKALFNSMALLDQGQVQRIFHKRLLPTYDVFDEDRYFAPGNEPNHFWLDGVHIGVTICEDLWNDEDFWGKRRYATNPISDLASLEVDVMINLSASPYTVAKQYLREAMLRHAAVRYNRPIVYVNQVGGNDDLIFDGSSVAFNQRGDLVCRARAFETDWVMLELDPQQKDFLPGTIASLPESEDA
ncbi:MAG: nitrilase-related carbon-nitrogen hydrolase, partial [Leptolyngbyaceae cyanobacterium bins.59]|nr:nitrilase-related carbon-nitrogen hydrolase [Leptolyngbyaceae cyanobacterium bins.59]